ncbi:MAG TPA: DUF4139 domain-containing protein [Rudaea sp.]|jgi:hypothetical protein
MRRLISVALVAGASALSAQAADEPGARYSLSIYNAAADGGDALFAPPIPDNGAPGGYAIVRDRRQFDLKAGANVVVVRDVSRYLDPEALSARALGDSDGVEILGQRFEDEPLSLDTLAQKHLGHNVEVFVGSSAAPAPPISGMLLSTVGGVTVQTADGRVTTITEFTRVVFPDLPKGLAATPSLRWDIAAKKAGAHAFEIVYPTQAMAWRASYSGWLANGDCRLSLSGWAQIANRTGSDFSGARIKLIAGEPHRATAAPAPRVMMARTAATPMQAVESGQVGDYHEYTLDQSVDLASGTLLRAALFAEQSLPCQRQYLFEGSNLHANPGMAPITDRGYGTEQRSPVRSMLAFKSERALPAGTLRILQSASDGAAEFVGEDNLGHTPRGQSVSLELGTAFDLRGERKQTDFQFDKDHRTLSESFSIRLDNGGNTTQTVAIREHPYRWTQWTITQSSVKYEKRSADTIEFKTDVPAGGNAQVTYTVQYQWSESFK